MIVKNESSIIERCLDSVKDIIDCVSICDTGSTDNTVEIIEQFLREHHIPGKVHHHCWENFGHNRSLSASAAQETLGELSISLPDTYLLLLDADMIFVISPKFKKNELCNDCYSLVQKSSCISYYNTRLIRASLPWKCVGVTHEYWLCEKSATKGKLQSLWIDDREDGGCKADKYERDVRLLTKGLEDDPDNGRYMFYLAQTYRCMNDYDKAIEWYTKRIAKGGWKEEVWYAKYMIGTLYESKEQWDQALVWYLDSYQHNPARAEPFEKIALHYRLKNQHDLAYFFAAQGSKIPYPVNEQLFIADPVYNYRFDEELSIAAYYTPFREEGFAAVERLLSNKLVPRSSKLQAEKNLRFYAENLKNVRFERVSSKETPVDSSSVDSKASSEKNWLPFIKDGDLYAIYSYDPLLIFKVDPSIGACLPVVYQEQERDFSSFKHAAGPLAFDKGYLVVVQHTVFDEDRCYLHRFVCLDQDFKITHVSRPFTYVCKGGGQCCSITTDSIGSKLVMSLKIEGREAMLAFIDFDIVRSLLLPIK
ncbi:MAG: glycosyltransferase [Parachlamydiaceae bacterium]